jgi:hypothetical protein
MRIVHLQASSILTLSTVVLMEAEKRMALAGGTTNQNPPPSGRTPLWRQLLDRFKAFVGYAGAVHKAVLLWRAILLGSIGKDLLRWLGWL